MRKRFMATRPGGAGALDWGWGPGEERIEDSARNEVSGAGRREGSIYLIPTEVSEAERSEASGWLS